MGPQTARTTPQLREIVVTAQDMSDRGSFLFWASFIVSDGHLLSCFQKNEESCGHFARSRRSGQPIFRGFIRAALRQERP